MNIAEAAACYQPISTKALKRMINDGLISESLTESDQHALSILCRIWSSEWYVAQMNKMFKPDKRALMLAFPDFGKIDRYILNTYLNMKPKIRVSIKEMSNRIREFYHAEYSILKIKRIRQIAYNLRRYSRGKTRRQLVALLALEHESFKNCR